MLIKLYHPFANIYWAITKYVQFCLLMQVCVSLWCETKNRRFCLSPVSWKPTSKTKCHTFNKTIKLPILGKEDPLSYPLSATIMRISLIPCFLLRNYYFTINEIQLKRRGLITEPLQWRYHCPQVVEVILFVPFVLAGFHPLPHFSVIFTVLCFSETTSLALSFQPNNFPLSRNTTLPKWFRNTPLQD